MLVWKCHLQHGELKCPVWKTRCWYGGTQGTPTRRRRCRRESPSRLNGLTSTKNVVLVIARLGLERSEVREKTLRSRMLLASGGGISRTLPSVGPSWSGLVLHSALVWKGTAISFATVSRMDETQTSDQPVSSHGIHMGIIADRRRQRDSCVGHCSQHNVRCFCHVIQSLVMRYYPCDMLWESFDKNVFEETIFSFSWLE